MSNFARKWIPLEEIEIFDDIHFITEDGWGVDEKRDGNDKETHVKGIDYIRGLIKKGAKIRPILAMEKDQGGYVRLDGFKRCLAHVKAGEKFIEAFVVSEDDVYTQTRVKYLHGEMWAGKGGQMKEVYTNAMEGYEMEDFDYDKVEFLYKSPDPHGLRIEACESIHVHWGQYGKYRLGLGRRDFVQLAKAICHIE